LSFVFSTYGEVTKVHVMPHSSGRVAAFVYYAKAESAEDAIKVLHDVYKIREDAERAIEVKWAKPKAQNSWGGGGDQWSAGGGGGDTWSGGNQTAQNWDKSGQSWDNTNAQAPAVEAVKDVDGYKLFVGGLPSDCTSEELNTVFSTYGEVAKVHLMAPHAMTGRVAAFVFYNEVKPAEDAIKVLDGIYKIRADAEAPIDVRWGNKPKPKWNSGGDEWGASGNSWSGGGGDGGSGQVAPAWAGDDKWSGGGGSAPAWKGKDEGSSWQVPSSGGSWGGEKCGAANWSGGGNDWKNSSSGWSGGQAPQDNWAPDVKAQGWGDGEISDTKLFVGNLPDDVSEDALQYVFGTYGKVDRVQIPSESRPGQACAYVEFTQASDAEIAIATLHEKYEIRPGHGPILVKKAKASRSRPY